MFFSLKRSRNGRAPESGDGRPAGEARTPGPVSDRELLLRLAERTRTEAQTARGRGESLLDRQRPDIRTDGGGGAPPEAGEGGNVYLRPRNARGGGQTPESGAGTAPGNVYLRSGAAESAAAGPEETGSSGESPEAGSGSVGAGPTLRAWLRGRFARFAGPVCTILGLVIFVAVLAGVCKGSLWLYGWVHSSPMFLTRHIDITGNVRLQRDMILRLGGLSEGVNCFSVGVSEVERRLRATPWVEDVSVRRILPDRFVIRVQERMPSFWVRRAGRLFYANDRGEIIAPVESENFMSLPILTVEPGSDEAVPYLSRLMKDMHSGILPVEAGAVATVDVSPSRGVELYFEDREMRLSLAPDDWEGNLLRLGVAIGDLARRRELAGVQEVRASDGSVWVVLRKPAQQ